ncbi:MAG TPA: RidA family protein [Propionibacteriaceae bacterium]|nr:RidA family protein [Propionibacteriaceae bacterium]
MDSVSYLNPPQLHSNPAFTQAVRIPRRTRSGRVVSNDLAGQARQALINLQACLREANADLDHVVRWSILIKDGAPLYEGFAAFVEIWGQRPNPPALTVAMVNGFAVTGALCEIEALAAVPST